MRRRATVSSASCFCLVLALAATGVIAGCGRPQSPPHLPDVTTRIAAGPEAGEATISVSSKGDGHGVAQVVLTYPDGHRSVGGGCALEDTTTATWELKGLRPGLYECTIYAVTKVPKAGEPWLARSARTEGNILSLEDVRHPLTRNAPAPDGALVYSRRQRTRRRRARGLGGASDRRGPGVPQAAGRHRGRRLPRHRRGAGQDDQVLGATGAGEHHRRRRRDRRLHAGGDRRDDHRAARHADLRSGAGGRRRPAPRPAPLPGTARQRHRREHPHRRADRARSRSTGCRST